MNFVLFAINWHDDIKGVTIFGFGVVEDRCWYSLFSINYSKSAKATVINIFFFIYHVFNLKEKQNGAFMLKEK